MVFGLKPVIESQFVRQYALAYLIENCPLGTLVHVMQTAIVTRHAARGPNWRKIARAIVENANFDHANFLLAREEPALQVMLRCVWNYT